MAARPVQAHPNVQDDRGKVAIQRGPIIYCAEWKDNDGKTSNILVPAGTSFVAAYKPEVLNGITELTATVPVVKIDAANSAVSTVRQPLMLIPLLRLGQPRPGRDDRLVSSKNHGCRSDKPAGGAAYGPEIRRRH